MGVFYVLLLVPMCIQHFTIKGLNTNYESKNKKALAIFFVLLTILTMLRHETVGNDTKNYIAIFESYTNVGWKELSGLPLEIGYLYYTKFISLLSSNPQVFIAITSIIVIAMIYPTYKRLCADASLTITLFCTMSTFVMMFSGIRQMLAVGIGFIAYGFVRNKKVIPFIITVIIATLFHASAFMIIFMYPAYHIRITKKWLYVIIPILAVIFAFNKTIFTYLSIIVEQYTRFDASITQTGAYMMLILFAAFTAFAFIIPNESELDEEIIGLRNFLLIAFVIQIFAPLHTLAMRMSYYYIIFIPLLLPKIIEHRSERWKQVAMVGRHIMVIFFLIYFFINASRGDNLHVFPYHFFWEEIGWL